MWCDRVMGFIKRYLTVPGAVLVFAFTYLIMLAVNAGETGAAWVQAVGSVCAILVAIWISERGHQRDRDNAEEEAHAECSRLIGLAERAVYEAGLAISQLTDRVQEVQALAAERANLGRLEQAAEILRGLLLQPLPQLVAADVFAVLAHVAELAGEVSSWTPIRVPGDWRQVISAHSNAVNRHYTSIAAQYRLHESPAGAGVIK